MKKEELTRRKILFLTSSHRFWFNVMLIFAIVCVSAIIFLSPPGYKDIAGPFFGAVGCIIVGLLCCLTYFIDILSMNIKTIEEDSKELLETISHAKTSVGNRIKVNSENKGAKKLINYSKVLQNGYDSTIIKNPRYDYKKIYYYLGLSKVVVFTESIPIGEKKECNSIGQKKKCNPKKKC